MNTEEKAKAYDNALEKAKYWHKEGYGKECQEVVEDIFPELTESEDEKVRKAIIELVRQSSEILGMQNQSNMLAWLEKQGEQKVSEHDIVKTIKERIIEHFDNHLIIDKCFSIGGLKDDILKIINEVKFEKQGEQKPINDTDEEIVEVVKDTSILDMVEQKSALSEEDELNLKQAIYVCHQNEYTAVENWLKSLKDRVQPIQYSETEKQEMFIKSQRPHFWRPSEEQIKALKYVAYHLMPDSNYRKEMFSLYEDLKKLKA